MVDVVSVTKVDEIAHVLVNNPPVNTIDAKVRTELRKAIESIESDSSLKAVVLNCEGKTFFSGADIGEFNGPPKEDEYRELFSKIENLEIPVVVAMHGTVMGGGLEIALACHYRLAIEGTRFALPEVTLGIIPGAGATQRLPRLIGVDAALGLIVNATPIPAEEGKILGFIDQVVKTDSDLIKAAFDYTKQLISDGKGPNRTSERSIDTATAGKDVFEKYRKLAKEKYPNRVAALTAVTAVEGALSKSFAEGLLYETELVNKAKATPECKGSVHLFFADRETSKIPGIDSSQARSVNKVAIIGAGTMGGGIAMCFANAGIAVSLIDISEEGLNRGLDSIDKNYASRVKRGRMTEAKKESTMAFIKGHVGMDAAHDADLIIEAVFEDMELKKSIFMQLNKIIKPDAIVATNTSTLDINEIGAVATHPENVIGLHFFSPANVMPLLEVIRTDATSDQTISTAMELAKKIRKTPVLAKVCYGFIGNRMMEGYAREAEFMALEGATPRKIDDALQEFGMAMGILAVFDMAGVDVGVNVHKANAHQFPPDPAYYQASQAIYDGGRMGQKNGKGFYRYEPGDRNRYDDPIALELLKKRAEELNIPQRDDHSSQEIIERCIFALINDGIKILEEGVAIRASDIDVVWGSGYGFPRYRGGPLFYADVLGLKTIYEGIIKFQKQFGDTHWQPANLLKELAESGKTLAEWEKGRSKA
ncbi:3-hydroxyacyl-CoA dehydrogenase NAD-binding domain-containing protein [Aurantivibrio infirmus]